MQIGDRVMSTSTKTLGTVTGSPDNYQRAWVQWDNEPSDNPQLVDTYFLEDPPPENFTEESFCNTGEIVFGPGPNPKDLIGVTKPPLALVPPAALVHMAKAMENGAKKYGAYNWRSNAVQVMIYLDAAMRHIAQYLDGEDVSEDSGVHHLGHAMACFGIVLDALETGNLIDNRPAPGAAARLIKEMTQT